MPARRRPVRISICLGLAGLASQLSPAPGLALGTLDVAGSPATVSGTVGTASAAGQLPAGTWSDSTALGQGWHGQVAITLFNFTGAWAAVGAATALGSTASPLFTGAGDGQYTVVVTGNSTSPGCTTNLVAFDWSGLEAGSGSACQASAGVVSAGVGTAGVTIGFGPVSSSYAPGSTYRIRVSNLAANAVALDNASPSATITPATGSTSPSPTFVNPGAVLPGGSPTSAGPAVTFLSAAAGPGTGTFTVSPRATVALGPAVYAAQYSATVTYSIYTGP